MKDKSILLWGGTGKARIVEAMVKELNIGSIKIIFDAWLDTPEFKSEAKFINNVDELRVVIEECSHYVSCIGGEHGFARVKTSEHLEKLGLEAISLMHPHAFIDPSTSYLSGLQTMPGSVVHKFCQLGKQVIINTNATVDHECIIGDGAHIMGGAAIAGCVNVQKYATIGTNATVLPHINIGEGAFIGAGAVVTKNIPAYTVWTGNPAKILRETTTTLSNSGLEKLFESLK